MLRYLPWYQDLLIITADKEQSSAQYSRREDKQSPRPERRILSLESSMRTLVVKPLWNGLETDWSVGGWMDGRMEKLEAFTIA